MRKEIKLLVLFSTIVSFTLAQNASFGWFLSGGGSIGSDRAADIVTDASGNIFMANTFLLQADFNGRTFNGAAKGSGASYDNSLLIKRIKFVRFSVY